MAAEVPATLHEQNLAALGQIGVMYMGDVKTISKAQDYRYLHGLPTLSAALGAREVGSQENPAGPSPATAPP